MSYYTIRDLRNAKKEIWDNLATDGEIIVLNNGRPRAKICDADNDNVDMVIKAIRQVKAMIAFNKMRLKAEKAGFMRDKKYKWKLMLLGWMLLNECGN